MSPMLLMMNNPPPLLPSLFRNRLKGRVSPTARRLPHLPPPRLMTNTPLRAPEARSTGFYPSYGWSNFHYQAGFPATTTTISPFTFACSP